MTVIVRQYQLLLKSGYGMAISWPRLHTLMHIETQQDSGAHAADVQLQTFDLAHAK